MIGKHFLIGLSGTSLTKKEKELLKKWQPIGVMLFRKNFDFSSNYKTWFNKLVSLLNEIKESINNPKILIATDFEGGRVHHFPEPITNFPFASLFKDNSANVAKKQAELLKSLGFNLSFSPVVDINSNSANPVIGPRAFGNQKEDVTKYSKEYMKALHENGILTSLKHFPGHGDTNVDSHLELPTINHSVELLNQRELYPFKELILAGAPAIMSAHIIIKEIDSKLPATLSNKILDEILRKQLNFKGIIYSDCVTGMRAIYDNFTIDEVISKFFNATGDIMLMWDRVGVNHEDYFIALEKLIELDKNLESKILESNIRINNYLENVQMYEPYLLDSDIFEENKKLMNIINKTENNIFLQEAHYHETKVPSEEPNVRVGVVLLEDKINYEKITFPEDGEILSVDGDKISISKNETIEIHSTNKGILIKTSNLEVEIRNKIILKTYKDLEFKPQYGFLVSKIIAGRIFHWRKEIEQTFTGKLEIYSQDGFLLVVNELPFEHYLSGVATSEMSAECPIDTLKAQAITARSYALAYMHGKHPGSPFSVCNDDDCQRYQGTTHLTPHIHQAILETKGEVITKDNLVVRAHYSKCCGGISDLPEDTWEIPVLGLDTTVYDGEKNINLDLSNEKNYIDFLNSNNFGDIFCHSNLNSKELKKYLGNVDEQADYFKWNYILTTEQLKDNLINKFQLSDVCEILKIEAVKNPTTNVLRTKSGRFVRINIHYLDKNNNNKIFEIPREYNIRKALHNSFLFSSAFIYENIYENNKLKEIKFTGTGWGHGAGYCQIGGLGMALRGYKYQDIIKHYFPNCQLTKCY